MRKRRRKKKLIQQPWFQRTLCLTIGFAIHATDLHLKILKLPVIQRNIVYLAKDGMRYRIAKFFKK
jgi:hypothetical protein